MKRIVAVVAAAIIAVAGLAAAAPVGASEDPTIPGWEYRSSLPGWLDDKCSDPTYNKPFTMTLFYNAGLGGQRIKFCHSLYDLCDMPVWNQLPNNCSGESGNATWHNVTSGFNLTFVRDAGDHCVKFYDARYWGSYNPGWHTMLTATGSAWYPDQIVNMANVWQGDFNWNDKPSSVQYVGCNP